MDQPASSKMTHLDKQFNDCKEEIRRIYCDQGKPLRETMDFFMHRRGLKASMRKWKAKLKDWGFEKYSKAEDMAFIASKIQSRQAEGKDSDFFVGGKQIPKEKIETFMKRKKGVTENISSPIADTPANIDYCTPEPVETELQKTIKQIEMEIGEESEVEDTLQKIREELVKNFVKNPDAEKIGSPITIGNTTYFNFKPEESEVKEVIKKILKEMKEETWEAIQKKEKLKRIKGLLGEFGARDSGIFFPIHDHDVSTMPVLLKVDGKTKSVDASREHEPDQEIADMLAKFGIISWQQFRRKILLITRCTQDSNKPPLFPKQDYTTTQSREAPHSPKAIGKEYRQEKFTASDNSQSTKSYLWRPSKDDGNPDESLADPLQQSPGADDAQKPKAHSFFRFPLEEGNVFQLVPESEAQLVPPEDVSRFLGLQDRNLDVAEYVTSAIEILDSTGPEQNLMQLDLPASLDNLAGDLETLGGEDETGGQDITDLDEEDKEREDMSSNPLGVTYTESCITGISWDYSALFP